MKFKRNLDPSLLNEDCDFWYDLTEGGYICPEALLANKKDVKAVLEAIEILMEFKAGYEHECDAMEFQIDEDLNEDNKK